MTWLNKLLQKLFKTREESDGEVVKPFLEHLEDLRWTMMKMGLCLLIGMSIGFLFVDQVTNIIKAPYDRIIGQTLQTLAVTDAFMISLTLAFYSGIVLSLPFLIFFAAEFVLPALTRQEKKYLLPGLGIGFALFALGVWVSYNYVLSYTLKWFYDYAIKMGLSPQWQARDYFSFVTHLTLACGLLAELPVVVLGLSFVGLVSSDFLRNTRTYCYLLVVVLVAIVSPAPDPFTFALLCLPVLAIYEICIWLVWLFERRRRKADLESDY